MEKLSQVCPAPDRQADRQSARPAWGRSGVAADLPAGRPAGHQEQAWVVAVPGPVRTAAGRPVSVWSDHRGRRVLERLPFATNGPRGS